MLTARRDRKGRLAVIEKLEAPSKPNLRPTERRAQATMMMARRILGEGTIKALAKDFNLSTATVSRRLRGAELDGIPTAARDVFIEEMLPQSMAVIKEALEDGDLKLAVSVALKIVEGLHVMEPPPADAPVGPVSEETFELFRAKFTRAHEVVTGPVIEGESSSAPEGATDASVSGVEDVRLLISAGSGSEGDPAAAAGDSAVAGEASGSAGDALGRHDHAEVDTD